MDPKVKNIGMLIVVAVGSFFFFYYVAEFGWLPSTLVTLLYMFLLYRSYQRKERVLAELDDEVE